MSEYKGWQPNPDITPEELERMRPEVIDKIITARIGLLLRHPFFGNMATRLKIREGGPFCNTAATDGRHLFYNVQFFSVLTLRQVEFVIAHEIYHCIFEHILRRDDRNPRIYNIACDYVVNNLLIRDRIGDMVDQIQIYHDRKYDDWSSEEVYDDIFEKMDDMALDALGQLLDDHIDWEDKEGDGGGREDNEGKPRYTKDELRRIRDEIKEGMIAAAAAAGAGNTPAGVRRMIKELTEHKMNWRELIRQQIQSTIKNDFTFQRPNRKGWHTGAVLPGMNFQERVDVVIGIDMSGSIGQDQATDFMSEIKGIVEEFPDYAIRVWCFDTEVYNEDTFTSDDGRDISEYEITGGGGTDFDANWEYMKEHDIQPKKFIMFTDGYPWNSWGDPDYCDTVFIIHGHADKNLQAPFGQTAHYEENA